MISPMLAAKAYAAAQGNGLGDLGDAASAPGAAPAGAPSFAEMLKGAMTETVQSSRTAEAQMVAGVQGKADLVQVVTALSSAQASLETLVAVRDQVISAYQEIMHMQI